MTKIEFRLRALFVNLMYQHLTGKELASCIPNRLTTDIGLENSTVDRIMEWLGNGYLEEIENAVHKQKVLDLEDELKKLHGIISERDDTINDLREFLSRGKNG